MKRIFCMLMICMMIFCLASCGNSQSAQENTSQTNTSSETEANTSEKSPSSNRALVVYFSATGNTRAVAETLAEMQDADLYEIVPENPYTDADLDYNDDSSRTTTEQNDESARPAISGSIENIDDYDVIYVGFPIWWGTMPKILYTFFDTYDLSGKTIAPFCTSGGSGISEAVTEIENLEPSATITEGLRTSDSAAEEDLTQWLSEISLVE